MNIYHLFSYLATSPLQLDQVKLNTAVDLGFPANDIQRIDRKGQQLEVELTVLGLLGVDSPLPLYMVVEGLREGNNAWRTFVNLINDYLYKLLFRCWLQMHPLAQVNQSSSRYTYYLNCLAASGSEHGAVMPFQLVRWFFGKRRSVRDLAGVIADYLEDVPVYVEELKPVWHTMQPQVQACLGQNAILGNQVLVSASHVYCHLQFDDWRRFVQFLYGAKAEAAFLNQLLQQFLPCHFEVTLQASIALQQPQPPRLSEPNVGLGYFNLLGQSESTQVTVFL